MELEPENGGEQRTGKLLVEDRDTGYLFLDPTGIPEAADAQPVLIEVAENVDDWENEDTAVWLTDETGSNLAVLPRDEVWDGEECLRDFEKDGFPIPTPIVIADKAAWDEHQADMGE